MKKWFFTSFVLLLLVFAQAQNNSDGCIAIKQTFYGIGEGKHEPILKKSTIYVKDNNKDITLRELSKDECLETNVVAEGKKNANKEYEIFQLGSDNKITDAIYVKSSIDNMANDDSQSFEFKIESLIPGTKTTITKSASDPYHNLFNDVLSGGKRNSYTLNTTLIYDVPVEITVVNSDIRTKPTIASRSIKTYLCEMQIQRPWSS